MAIFINQALRINFTTGVDDSEASSVVLKYRDPDGTEGEKLTTVVTGEESEGNYYSDFSNDELNKEGIWTFWSYIVAIDGKEFPGAPFQEEVVIPEGNYPVSREQIKAILKITGTTQDADIDAMLPVLYEQYKIMRNAPFKWRLDSDGNKVYEYPASLPAAMAKMYKYGYLLEQAGNGYREVDSEKIGSYSVKFSEHSSGTFGYPKYITSMIKTYIRGSGKYDNDPGYELNRTGSW